MNFNDLHVANEFEYVLGVDRGRRPVLGTRREFVVPRVGMSRWLCVGDSITNNVFQQFTPGSTGITAAGYFSWASLYCNGALRLAGEFGLSGYTTEQIKQELQAILNAVPSDGVMLLAGTNDFTNASISAETTKNNLREMAEMITRNGRLCCILTIPPKDSSTNASAGKHGDINRFILHKLSLMPGVVVAHSYAYTADVDDGLWPTGYAPDGTHPIATASHRMGYAVAVALRPFVDMTGRHFTMPATHFDPHNLVYNGNAYGNNAAGTNGWTVNTGVTGSGPDGWNAARYIGSPTAVASKVAESTMLPRSWVQLAFTAAANNDAVVIRYDCNQNSTWAGGISPALGTLRRPTVANGYAYRVVVAGTTGGSEPTWPTTIGARVVDNTVTWECVPLLTAGKRYVACAEFQINTVVGMQAHPSLVISCRDNGGAVIGEHIGNRKAGVDPSPDFVVPAGVIWSPEFILPENCFRAQVNLMIGGSTASGTCNFLGTSFSLYEVLDADKIGNYT